MKKTMARWRVLGEVVPVRVIAVAEGYAMVRRKGKHPFVIQTKQLMFSEEPKLKAAK